MSEAARLPGAVAEALRAGPGSSAYELSRLLSTRVDRVVRALRALEREGRARPVRRAGAGDHWYLI